MTALIDSERLADTKVRESDPMVRMHVPEAHEITDGTGVAVAVVDSGVQPGLPINTGPALAQPAVTGLSPIRLSGHGTHRRRPDRRQGRASRRAPGSSTFGCSTPRSPTCRRARRG